MPKSRLPSSLEAELNPRVEGLGREAGEVFLCYNRGWGVGGRRAGIFFGLWPKLGGTLVARIMTSLLTPRPPPSFLLPWQAHTAGYPPATRQITRGPWEVSCRGVPEKYLSECACVRVCVGGTGALLSRGSQMWSINNELCCGL